MAEVELNVVCKHCGAEVSPYITECPYCGNRLRKRAPKLETRGRRAGSEGAPRPVRAPQAQAARPARRVCGAVALVVGDRSPLRDDRPDRRQWRRLPRRPLGQPRLPRPRRDRRTDRRRVVAADHRAVQLHQRRLPVRRRRRDGDLRHQPRAALRSAGHRGPVPALWRIRHVPGDSGRELPDRDRWQRRGARPGLRLAGARSARAPIRATTPRATCSDSRRSRSCWR